MKYLFALLLLTSCAARGPDYSLLDKSILMPASGQSKIIVYWDIHPLFHNSTMWVELDGRQICDLHGESFLVANVESGRHTIESSQFGEVGTSRITIEVKPSRVIYIRMVYKGERGYASLLGGAIGESIVEGIDSTSGPVMLTSVSKDTALPTIANFAYDNCK